MVRCVVTGDGFASPLESNGFWYGFRSNSPFAGCYGHAAPEVRLWPSDNAREQSTAIPPADSLVLLEGCPAGYWNQMLASLASLLDS